MASTKNGFGQIVGFAEHGDAAFLHGFEQGGLGFRRGAVDFVGQHDVGEQRAGLENELAAAVDFLEDRVAGDVAGEQVGGELDALGAEVEGFGEALDQLGLAEAGQAFEQDVAAGEHAGEDQVDEFLLAEEHLVERAASERRCLPASATSDSVACSMDFAVRLTNSPRLEMTKV